MRMFVGSPEPTMIGEVYESTSPIPTVKAETQAAMWRTIRTSTRKEFIDYWVKEDPDNYYYSVELFGEPPKEYYYSEVELVGSKNCLN